ncbi:fructosamine kinase family protein [Mycobacterium sp. EPa45]|uniref:fructosamine kinase family protein n=1 Tax=Mycobacterium sp. EPa45 TaxID=1545728 RepID=UPI0006421FA6|nr:fructosamine kinase family protein [Mycobacterium sp. EPa45]AKK25604.1 fructosamine kinase [Mycobacterium sp. EPa45]
MAEFVKRNTAAPPGFFACEAAGLRWLASAPGGVPCARVLRYDDTSLTLERLRSAPPSEEAAETFGRRLAITHDAGAAGFGAAPPGWHGAGFFGPLDHPLAMSLTVHPRWGGFYADERLTPMLKLATGIGPAGRRLIDGVVERCRRGDFDDDDAPARLHGDLWSGNVMWTDSGAVLIDPAAHGGHRETDLAMLALFGCPHLESVYAGYQSMHPLGEGWRDRIPLHQLYPLLAHVALFGAGYAAQTVRAARTAMEIS